MNSMNNTSNNNEYECGFLGCYSLGVENVTMKIDESTVITILACEKHAKLLGDD